MIEKGAPFNRLRWPWRKLLLILIAGTCLIGHYILYPPDPAAETLRKPGQLPAASRLSTSKSSWVISDVTIRDRDQEVVFQGEMDVSATVDRIQKGRLLKYEHDGSVFANRENLLPGRDSGYYREYVHPTPGIDGPGPQRIVVGRSGEYFYTPDHYRTFIRRDE